MTEMPDDRRLLRAYVETKSDSAFVEIVRRHIDLVYSVALRQLAGDSHLAQDVAQEVFMALAHQARALSQRPVLEGWLYRTARYTAIDVARSETRRRAREQQALFMHETTSDPASRFDADRLRPLLDDAIAGLRESDRDAVVLRFFKHRSFAEVGGHLRLTENAARMRVDRALEKLQAHLGRRGLKSSAAAVAACLASQSLVAAPAGLVVSVCGAALASDGAVAGTSAIFMGMTKLQVGIACAVMLGATAGLVFERHMTTEIEDALAVRRHEQRAAERVQQQGRVAEASLAAAQTQELERLREEARSLRAERIAIARRQEASAVAATRETPFIGPYFEKGQVDQSATVTYQVAPFYPPELRRLEIPGRAILSLIIDAEGNVHNVRVVDATHPDFGEAAIEAVKRWRYQPARKEGRPVAMRWQLPLIFTIGEKPATAATKSAAAAGQPTKPLVPWF